VRLSGLGVLGRAGFGVVAIVGVVVVVVVVEVVVVDVEVDVVVFVGFGGALLGSGHCTPFVNL